MELWHQLGQLPELESLFYAGSQPWHGSPYSLANEMPKITGEMLHGFASLEVMNITGGCLTQDAIEKIAGMTNLKALGIYVEDLTTISLEPLLKLEKLEGFSVSTGQGTYNIPGNNADIKAFLRGDEETVKKYFQPYPQGGYGGGMSGGGFGG